MRPTAIDGRAGFCVEAAEALNSTTAIFGGGFCIIKKKGTGSYIDTLADANVKGGKALPVGAVVYLEGWSKSEDNDLVLGDELTPISLDLSCWVTDTPLTAQEGEVDLTTQCDRIEGKKHIVGDGNVTDGGTISGWMDTDSSMQRQMEGLFRNRIVDAGGKITLLPKDSGSQNYLHFLKHREMAEAGEVEITVFRKMRITQLNQGHPASGGVPFNFNYTTLEQWQYERTIPAPAGAGS